MALDITAQGLFSEVRKAREHRDKFLGETYNDSLERFVGPGYRRGNSSPIDFDNHAYKWMSLFLPTLASGNPRVRTKTPRQGSAAALAKAVEFAVNRNFELTNAKKTIEQLATDWAFRWCVAMTTARPIMGMMEREDPPYRPVTKRLSLMDYVWDPVAIQHSECRFQAHRVIRDRQGLLGEAKQNRASGWDPDAISAMRMRPDRDQRGEKLEEYYDRDEVEFWEVWVPEAELDTAKDDQGRKFRPAAESGFHGTIYTVSKDGSVYLRDPRPFWGPRDGPYTFSSYLYVPDRVVGLAPLIANEAQVEIHNAVWSAAVESCKRYKKGMAIASSASTDLAEKLADFEDLDVLSVESLEDIDKVMREIEVGGLTQQHITMLQLLRTNLEQSSGLTEAAQGQATGASTATEASIAMQSSGRRMAYMGEKFISSVVKPIAQKEAWYATMHPMASIPLGPEADGVFVDQVTGEPIEYPILVGGSQYADLLEDMDIEIEPISMRQTSELLEAEISAQQDQWIATFAPLMPQLPWVDWELVITKKAEQWRDPSWARTINTNKAAAFGAMMMQMNLQGIPGGTQSPQPRLAGDFKPFQDMKSSEKPQGFSANARPQQNKGPRPAGGSKETHAMPSKSNKV